jgi:uncharacterized protein (TIGR03437 family)
MRHFNRLIAIGVFTGTAAAQVNVATANYGNDRTNANLSETILTVSNVAPGAFGKLGSFPVDGQVFAQPLYAAGVVFPGNVTHNVLIVATQHNTVFAYDADSAVSPNLLWQVNLGSSVPTSLLDNFGDVSPEIGILSTPAIDLQQGIIYVVAETLENNAPVFRLHALDIHSGQEMKNGPVPISGQVSGSGAAASNGVIQFDPSWHIQRPALLLANGSVYINFGSHADDGPWHGWVFTYNASDLSQAPSILNTTFNGAGGSIWQTGRGMAADSSGNVYAVTGNGDYDGTANFSESFLKLSGATPAIADWFTPADWQFLTDNDFDISAGPVLIPGTHMVIGGDKAGQLYLVNGDSMGRGTSGTAKIFAAISSGGIFNLAVWNQGDSALVFVPQLNGAFQCYQVAGGNFNQTPISTSISGGTDPYEGLAISANGAQSGTGILWAVTDDNTQWTLPGTLHAYEAGNLTNELWNSDMTGGNDTLGTFAKFANPTVANGNVYVPTWDNAVVVYGLLTNTGGQPQPAIGGIANSASYSSTSVSPGELVTIFGSNIGPTSPAGMQFDGSGNLLTMTGDVQVLFDGIPAPMIYASQGQVNAVVPFEVASPSTQVQVIYAGQTSAVFPVNVTAATPAVFTSDGSGAGQVAAVNQDSTLNSSANPAAQGSILTIYAEGGGQMNPMPADGSVVTADNLPQPALPVSVLVGGAAANVVYAGGAPGFVAGLLQVNFQLPEGVPSGPAVPVVLQVGKIADPQSLTIAIQ